MRAPSRLSRTPGRLHGKRRPLRPDRSVVAVAPSAPSGRRSALTSVPPGRRLESFALHRSPTASASGSSGAARVLLAMNRLLHPMTRLLRGRACALPGIDRLLPARASALLAMNHPIPARATRGTGHHLLATVTGSRATGYRLLATVTGSRATGRGPWFMGRGLRATGAGPRFRSSSLQGRASLAGRPSVSPVVSQTCAQSSGPMSIPTVIRPGDGITQ